MFVAIRRGSVHIAKSSPVRCEYAEDCLCPFWAVAHSNHQWELPLWCYYETWSVLWVEFGDPKDALGDTVIGAFGGFLSFFSLARQVRWLILGTELGCLGCWSVNFTTLSSRWRFKRERERPRSDTFLCAWSFPLSGLFDFCRRGAARWKRTWSDGLLTVG